jgi:hypothetical protein
MRCNPHLQVHASVLLLDVPFLECIFLLLNTNDFLFDFFGYPFLLNTIYDIFVIIFLSLNLLKLGYLTRYFFSVNHILKGLGPNCMEVTS